MSRLQEDFWEQVAKPYGYERPMRHELRAKGYRSLDAYKVQVGTTRALKSEIETLEGARDKAKHIAVTAKRELDGLERQRVETRAKLGAVTEQVDEKRAQVRGTVRCQRVVGSMQQCVTTGRRGLRSRRSKPTRSGLRN